MESGSFVACEVLLLSVRHLFLDLTLNGSIGSDAVERFRLSIDELILIGLFRGAFFAFVYSILVEISVTSHSEDVSISESDCVLL